MINVKGYLDYTYEIDAILADATMDAKLAEDALRRFELIASAMTLPLSRKDVEVAVASSLSTREDKLGICVRLHPRIDKTDEDKTQGIALIVLMLQKRVLLSMVGNPRDEHGLPLGNFVAVRPYPLIDDDGQVRFSFGFK